MLTLAGVTGRLSTYVSGTEHLGSESGVHYAVKSTLAAVCDHVIGLNVLYEYGPLREPR